MAIICTKTSNLTLTFDHMTWTSTEVIYSLEVFTVPSLYQISTKRSRDIKRTTFFKNLDLDLWPCELNINRGYLLYRGIHCTKFSIFPAKRSREIEHPLLSLQTNRQVQNNMPPFFKGGIKRKTFIFLKQVFNFNYNKLLWKSIYVVSCLLKYCEITYFQYQKFKFI